MKTKDLLKTLENLKDSEFKKFKWYLWQPDSLEGYQPISMSKLETAEMTTTVDLMVNAYTLHGAVEVMKQVLKDIQRNDLVQSLSETSSEPEVGESGKTAVNSECDAVNTPGDVEHSGENDSKTTVGRECEIKSERFATTEKDTLDMEISSKKNGSVKILEELNKKKQFRRDIERELDKVIQPKNALKKLDDKKTEFEDKLLQKSKELAHQLKDKAKDEQELQKQFNSVWNGWVGELSENTKPTEDINYEEDQFKVLTDLGFEGSLIAESKSSGSYKKISGIGDYIHYVSLRKHQHQSNTGQQFQDWKREKGMIHTLMNKASEFVSQGAMGLRRALQYEEEQMIRSLIDNVEQQTTDIIKSKPVATRGYSPTYLQEVANNVKDKVTEFESKRKYALKKEFTVDLILYVFHRAESWLVASHKKCRKDNDVLTYLESKKMQYYNIFRSFCKGHSSAVVLGELICEKLKNSTIEAVCNQTAIDLAGEMKCSFPAFNGNRSDLEKHVLKSLAEKEDFDGFITYIQHPRKQVETFIKEEVKKYIFTEQRDKVQNILKRNVEDLKKLLSQALFDATEEVKTQRGDINMWVKEFSCLLKDKLTFSISCQNFHDIEKFDFLKGEIEKGLVPITEEMSSLSLKKMEEFRMKSDQILIDQLCNCCWVTCPFCAAVCTNTLEDHSGKHSVPFHRSTAVNGFSYRNTDELSIDFCTTNVASDRSFYPDPASEELIPYNHYLKAGPRYECWRITPDWSGLTFWKWFVCKFEKHLENHYKLKFRGRGEIPNWWRKYSKDDAIGSLDEMF